MKKIITIIILTLYIFLRSSFSIANENSDVCKIFNDLFINIFSQEGSILNDLAITQATEIIKHSNTKFNNQEEREEKMFRLGTLDMVNILHMGCLKLVMETSLGLKFNTNDEKNDFIIKTYQNCILCNDFPMFRYILPSIQ